MAVVVGAVLRTTTIQIEIQRVIGLGGAGRDCRGGALLCSYVLCCSQCFALCSVFSSSRCHLLVIVA